MVVIVVTALVCLGLLSGSSHAAGDVQRKADNVVELLSALSAIVLVCGEIARRVRKRIRARRAARHLTESERPTDPKDLFP